MRTTIDLDADLLDRLRREANRRRIPFKQLLNLTLRAGLERRPPKPAPYRLPTFSMGPAAPGVNLDKALDLAATLQDGETARELDLRK